MVGRVCFLARRLILLIGLGSIAGFYVIFTRTDFSPIIYKQTISVDSNFQLRKDTGSSRRKVKVLKILSEFDDDDDGQTPIVHFQNLPRVKTASLPETRHTLPKENVVRPLKSLSAPGQQEPDTGNRPLSHPTALTVHRIQPGIISERTLNNAGVFKQAKMNPQSHQENVQLEQKKKLENVYSNHAEFLPAKTSLFSEGKMSLTHRGAVLAINYYEQLTMASRNLFQLQCWAKKLNLNVVQPIAKDSFLRTPLDNKLQDSLLKFEDLYNLTEWKVLTDKYSLAPLLEWKTFLATAPRSVILVTYNYPSVPVLKARQRAGEPVLHPPEGNRFTSGCDSKWPTASELKFLEEHNFKVVHRVCFNFYHGDELSLEMFNSHILGEYSSSDITIIMDMWRGLGSGQRVLIKDLCYGDIYPIQELISPSQRVVDDAEAYINTHLGGGPFMAVMGRLEMSLLTIHAKESVVPYCLKETLTRLVQFKQATGLSHTFLSIDIGKYGSKKWRGPVDPDIIHELQTFVHGVYGGTTSISEWEGTFEAYSRDAGYVGLLQKDIVTRARCVLFVGGGAFQRHALYLYKTLHPPNHRCLRAVEKCTTSNKFQL